MGRQCLLVTLILPLITAEDVFFEGDLLVQDTVLAQQSPELFVKGADFKWPAGVVTYIFEDISRFTPAEKEVVRTSMENIQNRTGCVEFIEMEREEGDIVRITKRGFKKQSGKGKCWAQLGRQGGTQAINLGEPGCFTTRTVTHELLHTLGVIHEHTRWDRDDHVKIILDNVAPGKKKNFDIRGWKETDHSDTAYDYKSVMHYDMYAFSKKLDDPKKVTIQPHHEEFEGIGFYDFMSGIDAIEVALAYGCALKPEVVVEFVNDNVETLQTVQDKHTRQIEALMKAFAGVEENNRRLREDIERVNRKLLEVEERKDVEPRFLDVDKKIMGVEKKILDVKKDVDGNDRRVQGDIERVEQNVDGNDRRVQGDIERVQQNVDANIERIDKKQREAGERKAAFSVTDLYDQGGILKFRTEKVDNERAYGTTTGVYTVPYDGTYFFTWSLSVGYNSITTVRLYVDGSGASATSFSTTGSDFDSLTGSLVLHLTEGQQVTLRKTLGELHSGSDWHTFSGFLVT